MHRPITRRHALGLAAALAAGAATGSIGRPASVRAATRSSGLMVARADPVSMAMHLHASFSEGTASMDAHLQQATANGVDVVWWTEHDFRVTAHGYRRQVRFDAMVEPYEGLDWTWVETQSGAVSNAVGTFVAEPHSPHEDGKALRLQALGPAEEWGRLQYEGEAYNSIYTTNISDTTVRLDVLAETLGPDAELLVEIVSSYRPASAGRPAGQYTLQYRIGAGTGRFTEENGLLGVVASRAVRGWNRLEMTPLDDIAALWPDLVAGDAGLFRLRISVRARRGASVSAVVDRLRIRRTRRRGQESLAMQAELMAAYVSRYPGVRQHQGAELSLVRHMNRFGGTPFLPDYGDQPPVKDDSVEAALAMVAEVHGHGGLVSYNHPLSGGLVTAEELALELIETANLGADLLEVGTRRVEEASFAFDAAARNGVYVTATGVSDDHSGNDWLGRDVRWVSSAWAASNEAPELVDALASGRVWFADPKSWRGAMDISAQGRPAMGGVLVTPDATVPMEVMVGDLPRGSTVELVTGLADFAGTDFAEPATTTQTVPARQVRGGRVELDFVPGAGGYLRAAVRSSHGTLIGFSNPTWMFPRVPPGGIPSRRLL